MRAWYCSLVRNRLAEARANYTAVARHLQPDGMIIVDGGSTDGTREFVATLPDTMVIDHPFVDFVESRNLYMQALDELAQDGDLLVVSDSDEFLSPNLLRDARDIAHQAYANDRNLIRIRVRDEFVDDSGRVVSSCLGDWWKPLLAVFESGGRYVGIGGRPIHEELHFPSGRRFMTLDDHGERYVYVHRRRQGDVWLRAARNFILSGVGPDGIPVPYWEEFVHLLRAHGMRTWPDVEEQFITGRLPDAIKQWLYDHRDAPFCEVRDAYKAYVWLHPEQQATLGARGRGAHSAG